MNQEQLVPIVEGLSDLGGWGAFAVSSLFIARWMISRMDLMIESMTQAVNAFERFQREYQASHADLARTQAAILHSLERLENRAGLIPFPIAQA